MTGIDKKETGSKAEKQKENEQKKRLKGSCKIYCVNSEKVV